MLKHKQRLHVALYTHIDYAVIHQTHFLHLQTIHKLYMVKGRNT